MLLLIDIFSINKGQGYVNPSLNIIVTEHCSTGGCLLEEACEHFFLNQSVFSIAISYIISMYCEDYAGYFTIILPFLAFYFCSAYFIYLVSCTNEMRLPTFRGHGSEDPDQYYFFYEVVWSIKNVTDESVKRVEFSTTLRDRAPS